MSTVYLNTVGFKSGMPEYHLASRQIVKRSQQVYQASKRAKNYGVVNTLTSKQWLIVLIKSKGECFYCQKDVSAENLGIDHFIPMSKGGANSVENIVASCFICNCKKHTKLLDSHILI
jgi:5-methylcytosine-specific restriction endonuclease McrA